MGQAGNVLQSAHSALGKLGVGLQVARTQMNPFTESPPASGGSAEWSVVIQDSGRAGALLYQETSGSIQMSWEFGGGDVVAFISFEKDAAWRTLYPWAAERRSEIVRRVAAEAIRQKAPSCQAEIDERSGWINLRQSTPPPLSPPPISPRDQHLAFRERKAKLVTMLVVIVLVLGVAAIVIKMLFGVKAAPLTPLGLIGTHQSGVASAVLLWQ